MSDLPEALGSIAEGAIVSAAVEPKTGSAGGGDQDAVSADGHTQESRCLNCDAVLSGTYCQVCGQRGHIHRTLRAFFHDLLHGVLHFEGKFWRTLPKLIWRPGVLTREYIDGKRARYISPIAFFLFVVFVTYALFSALGGGIDTDAIELDPDEQAAAFSEMDDNMANLRERLQRAVDEGETENADSINAMIVELERQRAVLAGVVGADPVDAEAGAEVSETDLPLATENGSAIFGKDDPIVKAIERARENPQLLIYKLQTNAYKFSWMLIPLSAPFVWLLFPMNRKFRMYDHTIFVTYSIAFMIALGGLASIFFYLGFGPVGGFLILYAPFHMYRHVRGTYGTSRFGAIVRMFLLSAFAWVAIGLFVIMLGVAVGG